MLAAKRLIEKAVHHHHDYQVGVQRGNLKSTELDLQIAVHYGIPATASLLAFDTVQSLLAIATLDGRIKVIGGDGIEALLVSPNQLPYKNIEFLQNRGHLVSISNENDIEVWNLESRCLACCLRWESNITAFSVISGSYLMYIGDEYGLMSVVKYDAEDTKLLHFPYCISSKHLTEATGFPSPDHQPVVGILPQPCSSGNRVLIAYEGGLIIIWGVSEAQVVFVGGGKDLQLKDGNVSQNGVDSDLQDDRSSDHLQEKEISALCWASSTGTILAVGYVDGDILFWKTSTGSSVRGQQNESSSSNVVKLQLSSAERRLPVIVLHWSASDRSSNDCDGQLFIYGGDEIGSEEVLTILTLEWSSRMEKLKCTARADLTLTGSFADMILLSRAGSTGGNREAALFVLTNPGQLHLYDGASLSAILSQQERETSVFAVEFPAVVPMADPPLTVAKFTTLSAGGNSSKVLYEMASVRKQGTTRAQASGTKWPLTGGVPSHLSSTEDTGVERVYIAGYQDGSVRFWNASYPVLSLICTLEGKEGVEVAGFSSPVSNLDFCFLTLNLAVGNEHGLVRIYKFNGSSDETSFHFVTETKHEFHNLPQVKGRPGCRAVFSLLNSPVTVLQFANSGAKLAVGFQCGRVAVLDMSSLSVLFFMDCVSGSSSPIISITWTKYENPGGLVKSQKHSEANVLVNPADEVLFFLTKDRELNIIDGDSGDILCSHQWHPKKKSIAISMYVIEDNTAVPHSTNGKLLEEASQDATTNKDQPMDKTTSEISSHTSEHHSSSGIALTREGLMDSLILLCYEDSLRLCSTKKVIQGKNKSIFKLKHSNPCCWTSTLKKDEKVCGLVLLFQTGLIEFRSFPDFELVKETSLMSILRWNYKANMEKMMSSGGGQLTLANGCELAFISLLSDDNGFRIPESFPCIHDKVLAAAADAAISFSSNQKKKQGTKTGLLHGIVKGFKTGKTEQVMENVLSLQSHFNHMEGIFLKSPFSDLPPTVTDSQEAVELNIDDIEIDESPLPTANTSSQEVKNTKREKGSEREQLLGKTDDIKPRLRTPEEIIAQYRKTGDASSVAAHTRNKLVERQEKLERIGMRTAELQSGAEDFASMANELVKAMENRKWWQI